MTAADEGESLFRLGAAELGDLEDDWVARLYLAGAEWERWQRDADRQWLLGRVAAKDAVRDWLRRHRDLVLHPLELTLSATPGEPPVVLEPEGCPVVSISHAGGEAVALAAAVGAGVDLAVVSDRGDGFESLAFDDAERAAIPAAGGDPQRNRWLHRAWCAKEAAVKALRRDFAALPSFELRSLDEESGDAVVTAVDEGLSLEVRTWQAEDRVYAATSGVAASATSVDSPPSG